MNHFREAGSIPLAISAVLNPIWLPSLQQVSSWLALGLQVGGIILIVVQIRHYWKKSG